MRTADVHRVTNETDIRIKLDLDGKGIHSIQTGIPFLDHMLSHVAVHGLINLEIASQGDLEVDFHHTVEDCALVLGEALDRALGERKGIVRMASAYAPMDESLVFVAIDLSGRPYAVVDTAWHTSEVGGIPTSLFPHFLESLAVTARCNLHARLIYGRDDHHQAEALFKGLGRALDAAISLDPRRGQTVPSTKGRIV